MASSSTKSGGPWKYDVFLSFRGEDTRKIFVGHLYRALQQKAINAFIDSEGLSKGNKISELLTSIEDSRLSVVVLSQNYASSTWCLKELVKILDCMDTMKQMVVPIFYQVDPSDVRKINGKFAEAFAKHGENPSLDKEELESWRSALTRVADLSGWDSTKYGDDGKLIEDIVENTLKELIHTSSNKANGLVGMDSHIAEMNSRLCLQVNDVRVVGIWGMGGLGKTTIARAAYDKIASQFEHSCFLDNVKEAFISKREVQMQVDLIFRSEKYIEATFKIVVESTCNSRSECHCMTSYGLRFFHDNYMEVQSESMAQPTNHVEGLGAPFYPDWLEVRKSETEWEAGSSESDEERGTCRTLELLPEKQTKSKEEEEIMVVAEQGEGCQVLGSVCCCLSLSGCTMSLRKRETEREGNRVTSP